MHDENTKYKLAEDKKGFSLVELVVTVSIMVALASIATGSFLAYYHARSSKVAKTIDTTISQSKIDALSGRENVMIIRHQVDYDKTEDGLTSASEYYVELYSLENGNAIRYKKEQLGNSWVSISLENSPSKAVDETQSIAIKFNPRTGGVDFLDVVSATGSDGNSFIPPSNEDAVNNGVAYRGVGDPASTSKIYISSGQTYTIEVYAASGEHTIN